MAQSARRAPGGWKRWTRRLALISVDARCGPAPQILDRLAGRAILRTDLNGTLTLFTDANQLWVETER